MRLTLVACGGDSAPRTSTTCSSTGTAAAVYYLDLDPAHAATSNPIFGKAFRIVGDPSR